MRDMRDKATHAAAFVGYSGIETLGGPVAIERYRPLCGAKGEDLDVEERDSRVSCKRCLRMLAYSLEVATAL